jgi:carboxyl-terminal processing protease
MLPKVRTLLVLMVGVTLGVGISLAHSVWASHESAGATPAHGQAAELALPWQDARRLAEVYEHIKTDYVDAQNDRKLVDNAIRGMMAGLDSHSAFLDASEYDEMRIATSGAYSGVGIEVAIEGTNVTVLTAIEGTPAAKAGIQSGDSVLAVDDVPVNTGRLDDAIGRMRGADGTKVKLKVQRADAAPVDYLLNRASVQVRSVKQSELGDGYGYVRISQFSDTTEADLKQALAKLKQENPKGLRGLVLDLRDNPGGVLEAAVGVSDAFLESGIIVSANGRTPDARFEMDAEPGDLINGAPIAVLVNSGSASASEIVAGALRDHHRAVIVGQTTYGKGSVQTVMPLADGHAIKLTTSRYYTPSGVSIQDRGITPDIALKKPESAADKDARNADVVTSAVLAKDVEVHAAFDALKQETSMRQSRAQ